jgi:hypothetical protein
MYDQAQQQRISSMASISAYPLDIHWISIGYLEICHVQRRRFFTVYNKMQMFEWPAAQATAWTRTVRVMGGRRNARRVQRFKRTRQVKKAAAARAAADADAFSRVFSRKRRVAGHALK